MKKISYKDIDFNDNLTPLFNRPSYPKEIENGVRDIIDAVKEKGDEALSFFAAKFDGVNLECKDFLVSDDEINNAENLISEKKKNAIIAAVKNIKAYANKQTPKEWSFSPRDGVEVGERFVPLDRVGVYIPGGTAPLVSTIVHTAGIASSAGVKNIVAVTPPGKNGKVLPELLFAMKQAGVTEVYRLGGVYAIAALAYGTETIDKVEKIVGPGNAFVTAAKKLVYGEVAIDMVAGPSEIMVIADDSCNGDHIAADMLSQAEHGSGHEQAVLLSTSEDICEKVMVALKNQAQQCSRNETVQKVLENGVFIIHVENSDQAAKIANLYAPEHLEIMTKDYESLSKKIRAAGAIFLGKWTPEPVGDFVAGPSHVLPTAGTAKYFSGLTVEQFYRRMSLVNYSKEALEREAENIAIFAEMEGLDAHGNSALIRVKK